MANVAAACLLPLTSRFIDLEVLSCVMTNTAISANTINTIQVKKLYDLLIL